MVATFHNHTTFCDGKNTPREMVEYAIENGARAIGFSSHGYTPYDLRYCMKDTDSYIAEINRLKIEFKDKIEVYLGIEEDAFAPVDRSKFDYTIGSMHYIEKGGVYYPIDSSIDYNNKMRLAFDYDAIKIATQYYEKFITYIKTRKPDIIGHFDLITKFDEKAESLFLDNQEYHLLAQKYLDSLLPVDSIFEINVGAIVRGYRTKPYPYTNLLHKINKQGGKIILSIDAHSKELLTYDFTDTIKYLKDIGFSSVYTIKDGKFVKENI
ncbi:MAG: histidinol-phosphatase HisJ family protein [Clostridia bacterium]|nr:histidinol-phosphatase HisJ family protein [Clostridia bacterium]